MDPTRCSFCHKSRIEVGKLVVAEQGSYQDTPPLDADGHKLAICNECVSIAVELLLATHANDPSRLVVRRG